jgi:CRP/FNR family cyclic AMP-dependent transcriptional regulator
VDRRLLALFWHLAERWGRVVPGGVHLPLRLTHRILGQLVGARRPTVSAALTELVSEGEVARRADGTWQLTGRAPSSPRMGGARRGEPRLELVPGL